MNWAQHDKNWMCDKFQKPSEKKQNKTEDKKIYIGHGNYLLVNHVRSDWLGVLSIGLILFYHYHLPSPASWFAGSLELTRVIEIILLYYMFVFCC